MKIHIKNNSPKLEEIKNFLINKFPNYKFSGFNDHVFIIAKSKHIGANIELKKHSIHIDGYFPTKSQRITFILFVVLLGFIIPILIYFFAYQRKFSKFEKEVGIILKSEYGAE